MITSAIGRIFLEAYNEKFGVNYDAKRFFVEVYHPLFYNSPKYMQWVQNSPFVQMKKGQKIDKLNDAERAEKLEELHSKIDKGLYDASVAIGYSASEEKEFATTSGQVSNLKINITQDDIYYSWIGSSLGIGLQGGLSILFAEKDILLHIFDGWALYRAALDNTPELKGNQINTWNGQWLAHRYSRRYNEKVPMTNFSPFASKNGEMSVVVQSWVQVMIGISHFFDAPKLIGYIYNLGQTNTTIGFIPFNLEHIRRPIHFYQSIFGMDKGNEAESLWGTEYGFKTSCKTGIIGLKAMQPKGLVQYIVEGKRPKHAKDQQQQITYNSYIIWILAMLNNQELWNKSQEYAQVLLDYSKSSEKGKTGKSQKVNEVLSSINKKTFITALTEVVKECEQKEKIIEVAEMVNSIPAENVPYFLTLLRFSYSSIS